VIACAAPPARDVGRLIAAAQAEGWTTCMLATPSAVRFMDVVRLAELTGYPVRSEYKNPDEPDVLPPPDAIIVAPATVNTINKWAAGICDTLPLGILVESFGLKLPVVAVPWTNAAHAAHPVFAQNLARLASWGVRLLAHRAAGGAAAGGAAAGGAAAGDADVSDFPWQEALAAVSQLRRSPG
jgi:phosphopantothenoylcysteine decarboxylase